MKRIIKALVTKSTAYRFFSLTILDSLKYVPLVQYANIDKLLLFWKVCPYAQQNYASLSQAYELTTSAERDSLPGSIVECGVWRGGCAAVMAAVAARSKSHRKIWLFDSFEGMPEGTKEDVGEEAKWLSRSMMNGNLAPVGTNVAPVDDVKTLFFKKLRLQEDTVKIVKGWFQNTLPKYKNEIGSIAILRIDADWYESTKVCLEHLYDNVVSGGYVIIDDYGYYPGCKKAVDEFIAARNLDVNVIPVDYSRVHFRKGVANHQYEFTSRARDPQPLL
jgi:O-methyltransferase